MTQEELNVIVEAHKKHLESNGTQGKPAVLDHLKLSHLDFKGVDLSYISMRGCDFTHCDFRRANLKKTTLTQANFSGCDLRGANLVYASLGHAIFYDCDIRGAHLEGARAPYVALNTVNAYKVHLKDVVMFNATIYNTILTEADMRGSELAGARVHARLTRADLSHSSMSGANFYGSVLDNANLNGVVAKHTAFYHLRCPEEGEFIGWKKGNKGTLIKLKIPEDALRSSATTEKCRCSKAEVLGIWDRAGNPLNETYSIMNDTFVYRVGEVVEEPEFDTNRWAECTKGIHFFMSKDEALGY